MFKKTALFLHDGFPKKRRILIKIHFRWESEGASGWSYAHCLPYFKKAQKHELGGDVYRGGAGPLHVSRGKSGNPLHEAFLAAGQEAGYPLTFCLLSFCLFVFLQVRRQATH